MKLIFLYCAAKNKSSMALKSCAKENSQLVGKEMRHRSKFSAEHSIAPKECIIYTL